MFEGQSMMKRQRMVYKVGTVIIYFVTPEINPALEVSQSSGLASLGLRAFYLFL